MADNEGGKLRRTTARCWVVLALLLWTLATLQALAQDNLIKENVTLSALEHENYESELKYSFRSGFKKDVVFRAIVVPALGTERLIAIRRSGSAFEAFTVTPSTSVANLELLRAYESGEMARRDGSGQMMDYRDDESYQFLRENTPDDVTGIETTTESMRLSRETARRVLRLWERALQDAMEASGGPRLQLDGIRYFVSLLRDERGELNGYMIGPRSACLTARLAELVEMLGAYAESKVAEEDLASELRTIEERM